MLIGIDAGGTKNELVLCEKDGRVVNRLTAPGSNAADLGPENAAMRIASQVRALVDGHTETVDALFAGLSGGGAPAISGEVRAVLTRELPFVKSISNGSDALNGLYAGVGAGDGMVVIAGTGTSAFVRCGGVLTQVGGWGYLVDDAGSGFRVGADALKAAYRSYDGRGEKTKLEELCARRLELPLGEAIPRIYEGGKRYIATFSFAVLEAAHAGDAIAEGILSDAANALADHLRACLRFVSARPAVAVVSGGLIENDEILERVRAALGAQKNDVQLVRPDVAPVYGALVKAARNAGVPITETFRESFKRDYHL